jgi:hypothetical protein
MSILNIYQVKFFIRNSHGKQVKSLSTLNTWLSAVISDYYTVDRANHLLADINGVLNGTNTIGGGATQSLYLVDISNIETKIYRDLDVWEANNNVSPDFVLPTTHFKVILEAWRNYIQS